MSFGKSVNDPQINGYFRVAPSDAQPIITSNPRRRVACSIVTARISTAYLKILRGPNSCYSTLVRTYCSRPGATLAGATAWIPLTRFDHISMTSPISCGWLQSQRPLKPWHPFFCGERMPGSSSNIQWLAAVLSVDVIGVRRNNTIAPCSATL